MKAETHKGVRILFHQELIKTQLLEEKYSLGSNKSLANYSFYMGVSNDNYDEVMRTNKKNVCGVKIFMGSSTGSMLVDNKNTLEYIFSNSDMLIATHCEDEETIRKNSEEARKKFGEDVPIYVAGRSAVPGLLEFPID